MKKLILAFGLCMATMLSAQIDFSSTRFGFTGGATYSAVRNAHSPSGRRLSVYGGMLALIPIDNYDQFYLQPEIEYYGAGETGKDKGYKGKRGYTALYADNYISVPIYFKAFFSEAESEFFAIGGPRFNFLISQKVKDPSKSYYLPEGDPAYPGVNGKASSFNFFLVGGIGYSYKRRLEFTAKFDFGLTNTYRGLMHEIGVDPYIAKRKTTQVVSLGLNYILQ